MTSNDSAKPAKPGRAYRSARRAQSAFDTRTAILAAAWRLFREHGYGQVTVQDIARSASAAVPTVYASTGGKSAILATLIEVAMHDPIVDETIAAVDACDDPHEAIATLARGVRTDNERYNDMMTIMKAAAAVERSAADVLARSDDLYQRSLTQSVDHLRELGAVASGLTRAQAVDITWYYLGHESWHLLVASRHWTWDEAEQWLAGQLTAALLGANAIG